jgi:hypothetical protein
VAWEEKGMKLSTFARWIGPAAIAYGLFLVVSDMAGMPMPLFDPGVAPTGSSVVGSGLILWALVMLLVGMIGLYTRLLTGGDSGRKAAEREARYREWELDEEELLEEEFGGRAPEGREAEELLVTHATLR